MNLRVTTYDRREGGGQLVLYSEDPLYQDPLAQAIFGAKNYFSVVDSRLTPLGRSAVNHLCRGLDGVTICLQREGNRIIVKPEGKAAGTLYTRICSRLASPRGGELPLAAALSRDMDQPVTVVLAGSATRQAVPLD